MKNSTLRRLQSSQIAILLVFFAIRIEAQPPVFTNTPATQAVASGGSITLTTSASGYQPIKYQWMFNGNYMVNGPGISGAYGPTLTISNFQNASQGTYSLNAQNQYGVANSASFVLALAPTPPSITVQPANVALTNQNSASFFINATGTPPLTFQWSFNGSLLPGSSPIILIPSISPSNLGSYSVIVSNAGGSVTSLVATLSLASTAPRLDLSFSNLQPVLTLYGNPTNTYQISSTTDLGGQWTTFTNITLTSSFSLATPISPTNKAAFFRATQQ
jgi:hypothetical protein